MKVGHVSNEIPFNNKSYSNFVPSKNDNIDNLKYFFNELNSLDNTLSSTKEDFSVVDCKAWYPLDRVKLNTPALSLNAALTPWH